MSEWLKYRSKVTGKTVEELREEMRQRGSKGGQSTAEKGGGFLDPELQSKALKEAMRVRSERAEKGTTGEE